MFGFGKKNDAAVVETVCSKIRPLFGILEHRLGRIPAELTRDAYVVGYVVNMALIFAMVETKGRANAELKGLASLAGLQTAFASLNMSMQDASASMKMMVGNPDAKRGGDAADLILGIGAGINDRNSDPRVLAARKAVEAMPASIRETLGGNEKALILNELQEQLFFAPIEATYGARSA